MNSSIYSVEEEDKLVLEECRQLICGICTSIMIFPVTLPCAHHLCLQCFKKSKELVSLLCPFCRTRISCWARRAKNKDNDLIDWHKWHLIKTKFPDLVRIRTSDNDWSEVFDEQIFGHNSPPKMSSEGEIRHEFEELIRKENERLLTDEKHSQTLIEQILAEDNRIIEENRKNMAEQIKSDQQFARILSNDSKEVKTLRNRTYLSE